jgi:uncharacterized protein (DUF1778 family)
MTTKARPNSKKSAATARKREAARQLKASRFEARLTEDVKALFQRAAELRGQTLTEFVLSASREKAVETLQEAQLVRLTAEDQARFAEALLNPWKPSRRLREAAKRYRRMTG